MHIFVNDTPLRFVALNHEVCSIEHDACINAKTISIENVPLIGDVFIEYADALYIKKALDFFGKKRVKKLDSLVFAVPNLEEAIAYIKRQYTIIEAAGGIVKKDNRYLMIYRHNVWDLPKGKLEKQESVEEAACREVEEECNVKVELTEKIDHTWHTYQRGGKNYLKKTYWYAMRCVNDAEMQPQLEEDITALEWFREEEVQEALYNSYNSIRYIFRKYLVNH